VKHSYFFWYWMFQVAIRVESVAVRLRNLSQRRKMECIPCVPGFWEDMGNRGW